MENACYLDRFRRRFRKLAVIGGTVTRNGVRTRWRRVYGHMSAADIDAFMSSLVRSDPAASPLIHLREGHHKTLFTQRIFCNCHETEKE